MRKRGVRADAIQAALAELRTTVVLTAHPTEATRWSVHEDARAHRRAAGARRRRERSADRRRARPRDHFAVADPAPAHARADADRRSAPGDPHARERPLRRRARRTPAPDARLRGGVRPPARSARATGAARFVGGRRSRRQSEGDAVGHGGCPASLPARRARGLSARPPADGGGDDVVGPGGAGGAPSCARASPAISRRCRASPSASPSREVHEVYRRKLNAMVVRLEAALEESDASEVPGTRGGYPDADAFVADLDLLDASLRANRGARIADGRLATLREQAASSGFRLACLDLREHQVRHQRGGGHDPVSFCGAARLAASGRAGPLPRGSLLREGSRGAHGRGSAGDRRARCSRRSKCCAKRSATTTPTPRATW